MTQTILNNVWRYIVATGPLEESNPSMGIFIFHLMPSAKPNVIDEPQKFYQSLNEALLLLNGEYIELDRWFNEHLKPLLIVNNHNYFAAHLAVRKLSESKTPSNQSRFKVVLERIYKMSQLNEDTKFMGEHIRFASAGTVVPPELIASISSIVSSEGNPPGGAILKLHRLYKSANPPDVSILRSHDVVKQLVNNVFTPGRLTQKEMKIWLIAYSAFWNPTSDCDKDIQNGYDRLLKLSNKLEQLASMSNLNDSLLELINETRYSYFTSEPICATAMVIWLKHKLFDDDFYEWTAFSQGEIPAAFHALDEVFLFN